MDRLVDSSLGSLFKSNTKGQNCSWRIILPSRSDKLTYISLKMAEVVKVSRSWNKIVEPQLLPKKQNWICFSILTTRKYLKLEIQSTSESSGWKKIVCLFFGRSYGSTILFQDLLTFRRSSNFMFFFNSVGKFQRNLTPTPPTLSRRPKVWTFWEALKIWKHLPHGLDVYYCNFTKHEEDCTNFCVLLRKSEL